MKKFAVIVDSKYMVMVESTSVGGAEHVVLDNVRHVKYALADDMSNLTDYFKGLAERTQIVSLDKLIEWDKELISIERCLRRARNSVDILEEKLLEEKNRVVALEKLLDKTKREGV